MKKAPKIKIFVSHRIDVCSSSIDNEIFKPVRCGAIFDKRNINSIQGDDTGENISSKRMSFNELTVLYWAWKNWGQLGKPDYIGLCHYRRYPAFVDGKITCADKEKNNGCCPVDYLDSKTIEEFGLTGEKIIETVKKYDAVVFDPIDLAKFNLSSNYEAMVAFPQYHHIEDMDKALDIIKEKFPSLYEIAIEYMYHYKYSYLYNCFVMKKELIDEMCNFLFGVLFELEKRIDMTTYSLQQFRTPGTIAERLIGIFILYLEKQQYKIHKTPLIFVEHAQNKGDIEPAYDKNNVAIVSNFNNAYVPVFSVALQSIIEHSSDDNNYDILLACRDITDISLRFLKSQIKGRKNFSIRVVDPSYSLDSIDFFVRDNCYSMDLYYRIMLPHILKNYKKLCIVDADIICREDISHLFYEDINWGMAKACKDTVFMGYLNGMVPDSFSYCINILKLNNPYNYINTGILLLDAEKFREKYCFSYLREFITRHKDKVRIYEQDMLNILLKDEVDFLPAKFNIYTKSNSFVKGCLKIAPYLEVSKLDEVKEGSGGIVHYAAAPKPWQSLEVDEGALWWSYARRSPWYEYFLLSLIRNQQPQQPQQPQERYMLVYWQYLRCKLLEHITWGERRKHYYFKCREFKRSVTQLRENRK